MKSLEKSKILKDKPYLWDLVENLKIQISSEMEEMYGTEGIGTKAKRLIDAKLNVYALEIEDKEAVGKFLLNSFMSLNGFNMKGPKVTLGDRLKRIEERLEQLEKALEDDSQ
jgi:hypothetical protein